MKLNDRVFTEEYGLGRIFCIGKMYEAYKVAGGYYATYEHPFDVIDVAYDGINKRYYGNDLYGVSFLDEEEAETNPVAVVEAQV